MQFRRPKLAGRRSITTLVVFGLVFLLCAAFAQALCGPKFTNKAQAVSFFKSNPAAAAALAKEVSKRKAYNFHADQDIIGWLEQPNVKAFKAPRGYKLTYNTSCPNGPGEYQEYRGLYDNMGGKVMLWYGNKAGKYYPILKGYCVNAVFGPPVVKQPPVKSPPCKKKCKPPKKKCKKKCRPPNKCKTKAGHANGNCVKQTNTATVEQECKGIVSGNQCISTITQINNVCGNVNTGGGPVNQGGNCNTGGEETCVGQNNCNTTPPCTTKCHPEEPEEPKKSAPKIDLETINDFEVNEKTVVCARVVATAGHSLSVTFFADSGVFANKGEGKLKPGTTNEWCSPYTAPSEVPSSGYDILEATVQDHTTGLNDTDEEKALIKAETPF